MSEIIKLFGSPSFDGKKINNIYIADKIFSDQKNLKKINSILHPRVKKKIEDLIQESLKSSNLVFVEAALIYEAKFDKMFDYIVLITADTEIRMKRFTSSKKASEDDFFKREDNQIKQETKQKKAHFVFTNNGSKSELKLKVDLLLRILNS
jgi:dephospho-CoA kinase